MLALQVQNENGTWCNLNRSWERAELRVLMDQWRTNTHMFGNAQMRIVDERRERRAASRRESAPTVVEEMAEALP